MNLLDTILGANDGDAVRQLSSQFGLEQDQTKSALSQLLPALSSGLKRNVSSGDGLQSLLSALSRDNHARYLEQPSTLTEPETVRDGNGILGHLLGSKEVSRRVARQASQETGLKQDLLKQMLPLVATLAMGALSRQTARPEFESRTRSASSDSLLGMLSPFLDADKDGSVADDLLGLAKKFF
jgi:hypothetical protein